MKEVAIDPDDVLNNSDTYNTHDINDQLIIMNIQSFCRNTSTLKLVKKLDKKVLPHIDWVLKFHKNPTKAIFSIASLMVLLKP